MKLRAVGVIEGGDLGDIGAADKGASAGAGQDREPQLGVKGEPGDGLDDLAHQRPIETIQLARLSIVSRAIWPPSGRSSYSTIKRFVLIGPIGSNARPQPDAGQLNSGLLATPAD